MGGAATGMGNSDAATILFGAVSGALSAKLTNGNIWQGAAVGIFVSAIYHVAHKILEKYVLEDFAKKVFGEDFKEK